MNPENQRELLSQELEKLNKSFWKRLIFKNKIQMLHVKLYQLSERIYQDNLNIFINMSSKKFKTNEE